MLEARGRVGGRCWTVDKVDLGAQWIHSTEGNPISNVARELGLATIFVGGDSTYTGGWENLWLPLTQDGKLRSILAADAARDALEALRRQSLNEGLPDCSLDTAATRVLEHQTLTPEDHEAIAWHLALLVRDDCAADQDSLSFLWWDDGYEVYGYGDSVFADGYGSLVDALSAGLDIRLGHIVDAIHHFEDSVRIETSQGTFAAQAVIVTLPLGVLKSRTVEFDPPLPQRKREAIERLGFGTLNKVILHFAEPWWEREQYAFGCTRSPITESPTCILNLWKTHRVPALAMNVGGQLAHSVEAWSELQVQEFAMRVLRDTFGCDVPTPARIHRTAWSRDSFSRGAYSYVAVGSTPADIEVLAEPVGERLFFAGEATLRQHWATAHAAYVSGLREASRIAGHDDLLPPRQFTENRRWREMMLRANRFFNLRSAVVSSETLRERVEVLRNSRVFGSVPPAELPVLTSMFDLQTFADGELICSAGDAAREMYVVLRGAVDVSVPGSFKHRRLESGEVVGEYGMFGSRMRTATVHAAGATTILVLDYQRFQRFLLAFPESMQALLDTTVQRLLALESRYAEPPYE